MLLDSDYKNIALQLPVELRRYLGTSAAKVFTYIRLKAKERNAETVSIRDDEFFRRIGTLVEHVTKARAALVDAGFLTFEYENRREDRGITRCQYTLTTKL